MNAREIEQGLESWKNSKEALEMEAGALRSYLLSLVLRVSRNFVDFEGLIM
jgi:hypothetical protein